MAQRKPTTSPQKRPGNAPVPGARTGPGARAGAGARTAPGAKPPARKPNKSIVNQKQTPWGLIITTAVIVVFAAAIVVAVIVTHKSTKSTSAQGSSASQCTAAVGTNSQSYLNENKCAMAIQGVTFYKISDRNHVATTVNYPQSPPVGGNHSQYWANCNGVVYSEPLANENAVHMLEHGAIWITYNSSTISPGDLTKLQNMVQGQDREALSPYIGLKTPISLQAWGYQLFVNSASDPRVARFINVLRYNTQTTPEYGASCQDPYFDPKLSTPGKPQESAAAQ